MHSLAASMVMLMVVVGFGLPGLRRVENRLRARWIWRHGRERAAVRGVLHC